MTSNLEYLSEHLRAARRKFDNARHGGIVLTSEDLDALVDEFKGWIELAVVLESTISREEWNRRAAADRAALMTPAALATLEAMRPGSNVVAFPGSPHQPGNA